jgi:excisionase family DNA binding protein
MSEAPLHLSDRLALSVVEVARCLGVSERTVRSMLPELPHLRMRGRVVVPVDPLRQWLRDQAEAGRGQVDTAVEEILESIKPTK